jgi:CHAD domain-containing protein
MSSVAQALKLDHGAMVALVQEKAGAIAKEAAAARSETIDGVHDLRVASRRMRAVLKEFRPLVPEAIMTPYENRMRAVTQALGRPRELDVMTVLVKQYRKGSTGPWRCAAENAIDQLKARRSETSAGCHEAAALVTCDGHTAELAGVLGALAESDLSAMPPANEVLWERYKKLRTHYLEWHLHKDGPELHQVRIRQKKLRYACEIFQTLFGSGMSKRLKKLTEMHEVLGTWNDCRVMALELIALEGAAPYDAVQGYPLMREAFEQEGRRHRRAYEKLAADYFGKKGRKKFKKHVKQAG